MSEEKKVTEEEKKLWDFMVAQDNNIIGAFTTSVIGIGALFFAYGSIPGNFVQVRLVVALVGVGASVIIWMFVFGAHAQKRAFEDRLKDTKLMKEWKETMKWRQEKFYRYAYFPITRMITYFSFLVAVAWGLIAISNVSFVYFPMNHLNGPLICLGVSAIVITLFVWLFRTVKDIRSHPRITTPNRTP